MAIVEAVKSTKVKHRGATTGHTSQKVSSFSHVIDAQNWQFHSLQKFPLSLSLH